MNYNTTSAKTIVAKVYRDLGIEDESWEVDAIEWVGEALEKMGAAPAWEEVEKIYAVEGHKVGLPSGIMQLRGLWKVKGIDYTVNADDTITVNNSALGDAQKMRVTRKKRGRSLRDGIGPTGTTMPEHGDANKDYYILNPGFLHTSFEEALVILGYKKVKTDADGYPLVPDEANSDEAMFWYVVYKILTKHPTAHPQMNWQKAMQMWEKHKHRAKTKLKMPDPDEYEAFERSWVHMIQPKRASRDERRMIEGGTYRGEDLVSDAPIDNY